MSSYQKFLFLSQGSAIQGSIISVAGIIILMCLGIGFHSLLDQLVNQAEPVEDPLAVAKACYAAAFIYAGVFLLCYSQVFPGFLMDAGLYTWEEGHGRCASLIINRRCIDTTQ